GREGRLESPLQTRLAFSLLRHDTLTLTPAVPQGGRHLSSISMDRPRPCDGARGRGLFAAVVAVSPPRLRTAPRGDALHSRQRRWRCARSPPAPPAVAHGLGP